MDVLHGSARAFLTTADLAGRDDFRLGSAIVSPSARRVTGPGGSADVEPRIMQVLVALAESAGRVVTRDTLFDRCWGGAYVGDDSLNRAIAAVRRIASEVAGGSFEIETIPRTGYRLTIANGAAPGSAGATADPAGPSRRTVIASGAALAAVAGTGGWAFLESRSQRRFDALYASAQDALRHGNFDARTVRMLEQAVSIRPRSASAWGLLALIKSLLVGGADPKDSQRRVDDAEKTARRALLLDPNQPDALLALFELQGSALDWITRDRRLRQIISSAPDNLGAILELGSLTAATGLTRESWYWNERGLALEPLMPEFLGKRALKLWVFGRTAEADKVSDQLWGLYPTDPFAWFVRVQIYAFTGRVHAALEMLDSEPIAHGRSPIANLWRASLPAIDDPAPRNVAKARDACIRAAETSGFAANEAVLLMSALRELDTAFDIANGILLARGPLVPDVAQAAQNAGWRVNTQWMWVPPVAAMRADPRFLPLCDNIGLTDYWGKRRVKPDYMLTRG